MQYNTVVYTLMIFNVFAWCWKDRWQTCTGSSANTINFCTHNFTLDIHAPSASGIGISMRMSKGFPFESFLWQVVAAFDRLQIQSWTGCLHIVGICLRTNIGCARTESCWLPPMGEGGWQSLKQTLKLLKFRRLPPPQSLVSQHLCLQWSRTVAHRHWSNSTRSQWSQLRYNLCQVLEWCLTVYVCILWWVGYWNDVETSRWYVLNV